MPRDVSPEVLWSLILPYARRPIPPPMSRPPRDDLRQNDLVALMRVSKLFQRLCEPLLYRSIATDVLPALLFDVSTPSMKRCLSYTEHLYLEYTPRDDPPYRHMLGPDGKDNFNLIGRTAEQREANTMMQCGVDKYLLNQALVTAVQAMKKGSPIFKRLHSIAVASIYGDVDGHWRRYTKMQNQYGPASGVEGYNECSENFEQLLSLSGAKHFCVRDYSGPLNIAPISWASDPSTPKYKCSITQHFKPDVEGLILPLGHSVNWVSEAPHTADMTVIVTSIMRCLGDLFSIRASPPSGMVRRRDIAGVRVWCSTARLTTKDGGRVGVVDPTREELEYSVPDMADIFTKYFRSKSSVNDMVEWYPSISTPPCPACGSGPPA